MTEFTESDLTLHQKLINIASNYRSLTGTSKPELEELIRNVLDEEYFKIKKELNNTILAYQERRWGKKTRMIKGYDCKRIHIILERLFR